MGGMSLGERIEQWLKSAKDGGAIQVFFTELECDILNTMSKFERIRSKRIEEREKKDLHGGEKSKAGGGVYVYAGVTYASVDEAFVDIDSERDINFLLKELVIRQMNILLSQGKIEAWWEIMIWYSMLQEKKMVVEDFWEFYVLHAMIRIFVDEVNSVIAENGQISMLSLHSMQELTDSYFKTLFLLRRIEYEIEPMEEIKEYIDDRKLSRYFIEGIIRETRIFNADKVKKKMEELCWK
ncbi:MAG: hypothetical protein HFI00_14615 [Lachnospiraceae bacterium]|nr:hypothetical protein [Lachnospiraceae bacterium]